MGHAWACPNSLEQIYLGWAEYKDEISADTMPPGTWRNYSVRALTRAAHVYSCNRPATRTSLHGPCMTTHHAKPFHVQPSPAQLHCLLHVRVVLASPPLLATQHAAQYHPPPSPNGIITT